MLIYYSLLDEIHPYFGRMHNGRLDEYLEEENTQEATLRA
jgi:hypothetical protein